MNNALEVYNAGDQGRRLVVDDRYDSNDGGGDKLDLRALTDALRRRRTLMICVFLGMMLLTAMVMVLPTPVYTASSEVVIDSQQTQLAPPSAEIVTTQAADASAALDTEVGVIESSELAEAVDTALALDKSPMFAPPQGASGTLAKIQQWFTGPVANPRLADKAAQHTFVINQLKKNVLATRLGQTSLFQISYTSPDPAFAVRVANEYGRQYAHQEAGQKASANARAEHVLRDRLGQLAQQADADTRAVQEYRIRHNLLSTNAQSLTEQEVATYDTELASGRAQAAEDQSRLANAERQQQAGTGASMVGEAITSPVVVSLRTQRAEAAANLANLQSHYGPAYPDVVKLQGQIANLDTSIARETQSLIQQLSARANVSQERLNSIAGSNSGARATLAGNNKAMIDFQTLQMKAQGSQSLYDSYLSRYKETVAQQGTETSRARVVSWAGLPAWPSWPNLIIVPVLGLFLALGSAVGAALISELLFIGLTTGTEVEQRLGVRCLGSVPAVPRWTRRGWRLKRSAAPADRIVEEPTSAFAESFRHLVTMINFIAEGRKQVVMVTSSLPQEGKTASSFCLARSMALRGARVLLIDCDLRRRSFNSLSSDTQRPGLIEVLRAEATLQDAIIADETGLSILPVNGGRPQDGDLLAGQPMADMLSDARGQFDYIVLDTAPILPVAETRVLATYADAVVVLVRWRKTADRAVRTALRMLPAGRAYVAGVVLSRVNIRKQARFGHGDAYSYYRQYKSYYNLR